MKNYKSIKLKNPSSNQCFVRLNPEQNIEVYLDDKKFPNPVIKLDSDLLYCNNFTICQKSFVSNWLKHSSVYLGSISISSCLNKSNIIVVADSHNHLKSNFLTIVNPKHSIVRFTPGDIFEIILLSDKDEDWNWEFLEAIDDCELEFLGQTTTDHGDHGLACPDFPYAQLPRNEILKNTKIFFQKHFWFRFNKKLMNLLNHTDNSSCYFGDLIFSSQFSQFSASLHSILNKKYKTRVLNSLLLHKIMNQQQTKSSVFCNNENSINDVFIENIKFNSLQDGCKTKSILPSNKDNKNFCVLDHPHNSYDQEAF